MVLIAFKSPWLVFTFFYFAVSTFSLYVESLLSKHHSLEESGEDDYILGLRSCASFHSR